MCEDSIDNIIKYLIVSFFDVIIVFDHNSYMEKQMKNKMHEWCLTSDVW